MSNVIVNGDQVEVEMAGPDEQDWVWHNPNSVTFNMRVRFDQVVSDTEVASMDSLWEARFYRDEVDQPWRRVMGSQRESVEVEKSRHSSDEVRAMPRGIPDTN